MFQMRWGRNRLVWVGMATELLLLALLLYVPVLQRLFDTAPFPRNTGFFCVPGRPSCSWPMKAARPWSAAEPVGGCRLASEYLKMERR